MTIQVKYMHIIIVIILMLITQQFLIWDGNTNKWVFSHPIWEELFNNYEPQSYPKLTDGDQSRIKGF